MSRRESSITDAFVELADTLVDDFDLLDFLQVLVEHTVALVDVDAAGIMLADQRGGLRAMAASSHAARLVELFELEHDEGPCLDAFRTGLAVTPVDPADMLRSWPAFTPRLAAAGFASAQAVPMRLRTAVIGALDVFRVESGALGEADVKLVRALADVATVGILQQRVSSERSLLAEQLQEALTSRIMIEQAKGVLAEHTGSSVDQAFSAIRSHARASGLPLRDVAAAVIAGSLRPALVQRP